MLVFAVHNPAIISKLAPVYQIEYNISLMTGKKKVALGLSGGVDSSVCAKLLLEQGYDVTAVYLECYNVAGCRTDGDRQDAYQVAKQLNIPFVSLDFKSAYQKHVLDYFYAEYAAGRTPNPDVLCNREIKFGLFYDWAIGEGFDFVATGHYAKLQPPFLCVPADTHKDQTYFLCQLRAEQLNHILFPLADLKKSQVRALAEKYNLPTAHKKDSTGVCFVGEVNVRDFLSQKIALTSGDVLDIAGNVIGKHRGAAAYTLGQRHGFDIFNKTPDTPIYYVIAKDVTANTLTVGDQAATARTSLHISNLHFISPEYGKTLSSQNPLHLLVRLRHTGALIPCTLTQNPDNSYTAALASAVYGVGEGQFAVFYLTTPATFTTQVITTCFGGGAIN
jgi:tRNA-specific 2-thiouridylase